MIEQNNLLIEPLKELKSKLTQERVQPPLLDNTTSMNGMNGLESLQQQMMDYSNMNQDLIDLFNAQEKLMQSELNAQKSRLNTQLNENKAQDPDLKSIISADLIDNDKVGETDL